MNREELKRQPEKQVQNVSQYILINNHFKYQWTNFSNQKT